MRAAAAAVPMTPEPAPLQREARETTLLALVRAVGEVTRDDREVVATILHMLRSGEVWREADRTLIASGQIELACLDMRGPARKLGLLPEDLRRSLEGALG